MILWLLPYLVPRVHPVRIVVTLDDSLLLMVLPRSETPHLPPQLPGHVPYPVPYVKPCSE